MEYCLLMTVRFSGQISLTRRMHISCAYDLSCLQKVGKQITAAFRRATTEIIPLWLGRRWSSPTLLICWRGCVVASTMWRRSSRRCASPTSASASRPTVRVTVTSQSGRVYCQRSNPALRRVTVAILCRLPPTQVLQQKHDTAQYNKAFWWRGGCGSGTISKARRHADPRFLVTLPSRLALLFQ